MIRSIALPIPYKTEFGLRNIYRLGRTKECARCLQCGGAIRITHDWDTEAMCRSCVWDLEQVRVPACDYDRPMSSRLDALVAAFEDPDIRAAVPRIADESGQGHRA